MDGLAIACGTTFFFATMLLIIFGFFGYLRWIRYKETLMLAEKGLLRSSLHAASSNGYGTLRWGIVTAALGFALCLGLYPLGWLVTGGMFPLNFGPWMLLGLIPTFFGIALIVIYLLTSNRKKEQSVPGSAAVFTPPADSQSMVEAEPVVIVEEEN